MQTLLETDWLFVFFVAALPLHLLVCGLSLASLRNREVAYLARKAMAPLLVSLLWLSVVSIYTLLVVLARWMLRDYRADLTGKAVPIAVAIFTGACAVLQIVYWAKLPEVLRVLIDATEPFGLY